MDVQAPFNLQSVRGAQSDQERQILIDYAPSIFSQTTCPAGHNGLSLEWMTAAQKTKLAVELAHSVPVPAFLKKIGLGVYRFWFRRLNAGSSV
jgi:hypothetical protein